MPNWCSNTIIITGKPEKIKLILDKLNAIPDTHEPVVFKTLIGQHPDIEEMGWYDANIEYYGTKWDVCLEDCYAQLNDDEIVLCPDTAWSPPSSFCQILARTYGVNVSIEYSEGGCDFAGKQTFDDYGIIVSDENYTYYHGMYIINNQGFWEDMECYYMTDNTLDGKSIDEYIESYFNFLDDKDKKELNEIFTRLYDEQKEQE